MKFCRFLLFFLFSASVFFLSCQRDASIELAQWMKDDGKIKALCTTAMVADLVKNVGNGDIDCYVLIKGEHDPHSYQLVKGDDEKFARADIIFYNGLGLEHAPSLLQQITQHTQSHALGDMLYKRCPERLLTADGVMDPHIWMDVSLFAQALDGIAQALGDQYPEKKEFFMHNADIYKQKLLQLHENIASMMEAIPQDGRYLVTTHDAFCYFARAYLATDDERRHNSFWARCQAPEGLAPDSQLSTRDITRLLDHVIKYHIRCLFAESNISRDSIRKLLDASERKGHPIHIAKQALYGDAMGAAGSDGGTYEKMMLHNAALISKELALQGGVRE